MALFDRVRQRTAENQGLQKGAIENRYLPDKLKYANELMKNQSGLLGAELPYAPDKFRLANELAKQNVTRESITNQFLPTTLGVDNDYKRAQTGLASQQTRLMPLETIIKAQQAGQSASRFGGAYQLSKALEAMSPAAREIWVSQNQDQYNQMIADLGNKQNSNIVTPELINKFLPGSIPTTPAANGRGGIMGAPPAPAFSPSTPQQIEQTRRANQIAANNSLTTNATRRQVEGAIQVEGIFNDPMIQSQVVNASKYAGALGKGKSAVDALMYQNPKSYTDYLAFQNQTKTLLENRIKTLDQMGATDEQRKDLQNLFDKTMSKFTSNPEQFITGWDNLGKALDVVARSAQQSATPVSPVNRLEGVKPVSQSGMILMQGPDGKQYNIPANNVDRAISSGFQRAK